MRTTPVAAKGLTLEDRIIYHGKVWAIEHFAGGNIGIRSIVDDDAQELPVHALVLDPTFEVVGLDPKTIIDRALESANLDRIPAEHQRRALVLARDLEEVMRGVPYLPDEDPPANFVPRRRYDPRKTTLKQRLRAKSRDLKLRGSKLSVRTLERRIEAYRLRGVLGLFPKRLLGAQVRRTEWSLAYMERLAANIFLEMNGPEMGQSAILATTNNQIRQNPDLKHVEIPSLRTQRRLFKVIAAQMGWRLGRRKYVQSLKQRPTDTHLSVKPLMPGERVEVDSTLLNVRVFDPVTRRIVRPFITAMLCVATRMVIGLVIGFVEDHTVVSHALLDAMTPKPSALLRSADSYVNRLGIPPDLLFELYPGMDPEMRLAAGPLVNPTLLVFDQGKPFFNNHTRLRLGRLGTAYEVARGRTPTDKPHVERFFGSLESLLVHLKGYTAEDVAARGKDEKLDPSQFLTLAQLDTIIRAWIAVEYHAVPHSSLHVPVSRGGTRLASPMEMYQLLVDQHGFIPVPLTPSLRFMLMDTKELTIQDDGIHFKGLIYNSALLDHVRRARCRWTKSGKWVVHSDPSDCRSIHIQVPDGNSRVWVEVPWRHMPPAMKFACPMSVMEFLRTNEPIKGSDGTVRAWKPPAGVMRLSSVERAERVLELLEWAQNYVSDHQEIGDSKDRKIKDKPEVIAFRALLDVAEGTKLEEMERRHIPVERQVGATPGRARRKLKSVKPRPDVPAEANLAELDQLSAWKLISGHHVDKEPT